MPTLQVRNIPQELYDKLKKSAEIERRSISQQTIVLLEKVLSIEEQRALRKAALKRMLSLPPVENSLDPEELIRQMRDEG